MKGYVINLETETLANNNFRKVLYTAAHSQLVLMSLLPQEVIDEEVHDVDQFLRIEQGTGQVVIDGVSHEIADGVSIVIPKGATHTVINTGADAMKLYSLYMPPHHKDGTIHPTKADAHADTADEFDGTTTE